MKLAVIRDARWLGRERTTAYARLAVLAYVPNFLLIFIVATNGQVDFLSFWTAARAALQAGAAMAYDLGAQMKAQDGYEGFLPFMYPPSFLAIILPFGLLPYISSYAAWVITTYAAYLSVARKLLPEGIWPIAAYPAAFHASAIGQNSGFTTALFCAATLTYRTRPFLSGIFLGGFIIKPQLALLFPVAMIAARQWTVVVGAVVSSVGLILLSLIMFGQEAWVAFFNNSHFMRLILEDTPRLWPLMVSIFGPIRMAGGPLWLAYGCQAILSIALAILIFGVWQRDGDDRTKFAILAICSVLATPYVLNYDLLLLIVPICWFAEQALRSGFRPWTKFALASVYLLPFASFAFSYGLGVNLAWCVVAAFLVLALNRVVHDRCRST